MSRLAAWPRTSDTSILARQTDEEAITGTAISGDENTTSVVVFNGNHQEAVRAFSQPNELDIDQVADAQRARRFSTAWSAT